MSLISYNVSSDIFYKILENNKKYVKEVSNIDKFLNGSKFKAPIFYDKLKKIVCREKLLFENKAPEYKQCIVYKDNALKSNTIKKQLSGGSCWRTVKNAILKFYDENYFNQTLQRFSDVKQNIKNCQLHFIFYREKNKIYNYSDAILYDINGAYTSVLCDLFPLAREKIKSLYKKNKSYINFFTGMLCKKGFRGAYNYIVSEIRKKIDKRISEVGGILLYANTDGFIVYKAKNIIKSSEELGQFKIKYIGNIFMYYSKNYWIIQSEDLYINLGNALYDVRKFIDLKKGLTVEYIKEKKSYTYIAKNIKKVYNNKNEKNKRQLI